MYQLFCFDVTNNEVKYNCLFLCNLSQMTYIISALYACVIRKTVVNFDEIFKQTVIYFGHFTNGKYRPFSY